MAWINEFLQTWIYKLRRCIGADRCRFFYGAINSHMARSASGEAKIFFPSLPSKIRPPIKVRPQFIDLPPYRPLPSLIGKLMPTITQRPCNPSHYRPSNFATDVVALWWNAICPTSSLSVVSLAKNSWDRSRIFFSENYILYIFL